MIVSHERKFIFLKVPKTAGSSVQSFLAHQLCGPDDLVTVGGGVVQHDRFWFNPIPELVADPRSARTTLGNFRTRRALHQHTPAWRVKPRIGKRVWDEYFTFCFERNPWDRVVSYYFWRTRDLAERPPLADWLDQQDREGNRLSTWDIYTIDDRVAVDFIGRYERLEEDLAQILDRLGVDIPIELDHKKGQFRPADDGGIEFTPEIDDWIAHHFRREIELMGYQQPSRR